jgi:hypothetical protein
LSAHFAAFHVRLPGKLLVEFPAVKKYQLGEIAQRGRKIFRRLREHGKISRAGSMAVTAIAFALRQTI